MDVDWSDIVVIDFQPADTEFQQTESDYIIAVGERFRWTEGGVDFDGLTGEDILRETGSGAFPLQQLAVLVVPMIGDNYGIFS